MKNIAIYKRIIWVISVLILILAAIKITESCAFDPLFTGEPIKADLFLYTKGTYKEITINQGEALSTLCKIRNSCISGVSVFNSKLRDSETAQKDSEIMIDLYYDKGKHQRIEITGEHTLLFAYCDAGEYPSVYLHNKDNIAYGLEDYTRQIFYLGENEINGQ